LALECVAWMAHRIGLKSPISDGLGNPRSLVMSC